ncbi:MAG: IclR family transcriptional regulator [Thermoleophilia bacterium]
MVNPTRKDAEPNGAAESVEREGSPAEMVEGAPPPASGGRARREGVQVIARAAEIIRLLAAASNGLTLSELARGVGLPRSTAHRIVGALESEAFVRADAAGALRLGPALIGLAVGGRRDLRHETGPFLQRLSQELGETVDLAVLDNGHVLFVDQYTSQRRLRIVSEIGARFPLHCTANGKALLAELSLEEVWRLVPEELPMLTEHTIGRREELLEELARVRAEGVAYDREEHSVGMSAVGTAVRDAAGNMAAVTVVTPTSRFEGNEERIATALLRAREDMQAALRGG